MSGMQEALNKTVCGAALHCDSSIQETEAGDHKVQGTMSYTLTSRVPCKQRLCSEDKRKIIKDRQKFMNYVDLYMQ